MPARVLKVHPVPQKAGYIIYCERPKGQQPKTAAAAKKMLGKSADEILYQGPHDHFLRKDTLAQAVMRMWKPFRAD